MTTDDHRGNVEPRTALPQVPSEFEAIGPPLARGSSAVVWRARNRVTGREVALKVWLSPLDTAEERGHFEAESRRHLELPENPHIVRWLWAAAPADGPPWLATELHGESLGTILRRQGPLPLAAGLVIALDLLDGLAVMHRSGMVHRDVKPDNVLVTADRAALCDLGVSTSVAEPAVDPEAGTHSYLAPELTDGDPDGTANFRSDVYSAARTIRQALGTDVPLAVDQLLTRAQSTAPQDRPSDAVDFAERLSRIAADLGFGFRAGLAGATATATVTPPGTTTAPVNSARRPGSRSRRPRRALVAVVVAATVLLICAGVAVLVLHHGTPPAAAPAATDQQTQLPVGNAASSGSASSGSAGGGGLAAAHLAPDIAADGHPVLLNRRPDNGHCSGAAIPGASVDHRVGSATVATTTLYRDPAARTLCAYFRKAHSDTSYDKRTYLSLSLCNSAGKCDSDWYTYKWWAGPVTVDDTVGCASIRVSMTDLTGTRWLLKDEVDPIGC